MDRRTISEIKQELSDAYERRTWEINDFADYLLYYPHMYSIDEEFNGIPYIRFRKEGMPVRIYWCDNGIQIIINDGQWEESGYAYASNEGLFVRIREGIKWCQTAKSETDEDTSYAETDSY